MKNLAIVVLFTFALSGLGVAATGAHPARAGAPGFNASGPGDDRWDEDKKKKKKKKKDGGEEDEEEYRLFGQASRSGSNAFQV
jgi:hypothetical protein